MNKSRDDVFDDPDTVAALDELPLWSAHFGLTLLDMLPMRKGLTLLDIGSGVGFPTLEVAERLGRSSRCYGIDPWNEAVIRAVEKSRIHDIRNAWFIRGIAERLPFPDRSFDILISNNGINNVTDLSRCLSECHRVSRPDSVFLFTVNLPGTMIEFYREFRMVLVESRLDASVEKLEEHIFTRRKPFRLLSALLEAAGFEITKSIHRDFHLRYADVDALLQHHFIRLAFLPSWSEIIGDTERETILKRLTDRFKARFSSMGEIRLTIPYVCVICRPNKTKDS